MKTNTVNKKKLGGISMPKVVIPLAVVLAILHTMIIIVIMVIGGSSKQMTTLISNYESYADETSGILQRSSVISETASTFCLNPTMGGGEETEIGPLVTYVTYYANKELDAQVIAEGELIPGETVKELSR